jgi:hypothetical protein
MHRYGRDIRRILAALFICLAACADAVAADYLPLQVNTRWVLKRPGGGAPVTLEVLSKKENPYRIRFMSPWGENEWDLEQRGSAIHMVAYGQNGNLAPMPAGTVFFSFAGKQGETWNNAIGTLSAENTHVLVSTGSLSFRECIRIKQVSGKTVFSYTFAPGVGFVQFDHEQDAFVLDPSASRLPGARSPGADGPSATSNPPLVTERSKGGVGKLLVGITASTFANESTTPRNLLARFDQISQAGITYLS